MNDRVTGNGLYDLQKQKGRREYEWQARSIKGLDGKWVSYDNLGAFSDWMALTVDIMDNGLDFNLSGKGTLRSNDIGENLRAMGFVLAASVTDKSFLAGIEPLMDVARGDVGAMNRWASSFLTSALTPGASQMAEISRLMYPQLRVVDNNLQQLVRNRNPITKGTLPIQYDWIDGGAIKEPPNFWTRVWNTYLPWKVSGAISPEKQFLMDVGYDGIPSLQSNGNGAAYTSEERSELTSIMGREGYFKEEIKRIMGTNDAKAFREKFRKAQAGELQPDVRTMDMLHDQLDMALNTAKKQAESMLSNAAEVQLRGSLNQLLDRQMSSGDLDKAQLTKQLIDNGT